jgi:hypothetical protein
MTLVCELKEQPWRGKRLNLAEETFVGLCEAACVPLQNRADDKAWRVKPTPR